jgi:hypothetical protein
MRTFDPVIGRYYNPEQEEVYQEELKKREQSHGKDINEKLPPSYIKRESFVQEWNAPPNPIVKELDEKKER